MTEPTKAGKTRILLQFDSDQQPSVFDAVVALDAGVDHILRHGAVTSEVVQNLVHGAIFTRAQDEVNRTAIFIGGSDVLAGEGILAAVVASFFGPMRVSVLMDSNGSNTTAAAAVTAVTRHCKLDGAIVAVLGGTGPVGRRAAQLLVREGAHVRLGSRSVGRADRICQVLRDKFDVSDLNPVVTETPDDLKLALDGVDVVIAAGAAGVELLSQETRLAVEGLQVAIDLNAVPPVGVGGIDVTDKGVDRDGHVCYGALGVGGMKMQIHKTLLRKLFEVNNQVFDAEEIFQVAQEMEQDHQMD